MFNEFQYNLMRRLQGQTATEARLERLMRHMTEQEIDELLALAESDFPSRLEETGKSNGTLILSGYTAPQAVLMSESLRLRGWTVVIDVKGEKYSLQIGA